MNGVKQRDSEEVSSDRLYEKEGCKEAYKEKL